MLSTVNGGTDDLLYRLLSTADGGIDDLLHQCYLLLIEALVIPLPMLSILLMGTDDLLH